MASFEPIAQVLRQYHERATYHAPPLLILLNRRKPTLNGRQAARAERIFKWLWGSGRERKSNEALAAETRTNAEQVRSALGHVLQAGGRHAARALQKAGFHAFDPIHRFGKAAADLIAKHGEMATTAIRYHGRDAIKIGRKHDYDGLFTILEGGPDAALAIRRRGQKALDILGDCGSPQDTRLAAQALNAIGAVAVKAGRQNHALVVEAGRALQYGYAERLVRSELQNVLKGGDKHAFMEFCKKACLSAHSMEAIRMFGRTSGPEL